MSIYEKKYIRWYIQSNKKNLLCYVTFLFVCLPLLALLFPFQVDEQGVTLPFNVQILLYAILLFASIMIMPLYNFKFLMQKRSIDTYFAMPIRRKQFFKLQFFLGIGSVLLLVNGAFLLAMLFDRATWGLWKEFMTLLLLTSIIATCMYTLYCFLIMKCNNIWDAIVICVGYTLLPIVVFSALHSMIETASASFLLTSVVNVEEVFPFSFYSALFSPLIMVTNGFENFFNALLNVHVDHAYFYDVFFTVKLCLPLGIWIVVSLLLYQMAQRAFVHRGGEESEQRTTSWVCYPVMIVLLVVSLLMNEGASIQSFQAITKILFVFALYVIMVSFANRKIALTKRMLVIFVVIVISVVSLTALFTSTHGFNRIKEIPEQEVVESVTISINGQGEAITYDGVEYSYLQSKDLNTQESINEVIVLHKALLKYANKEEVFYGNIQYVSINFTLKDGEFMRREYQFSKDIVPLFENLIEKGVFDEDMKYQETFQK